MVVKGVAQCYKLDNLWTFQNRFSYGVYVWKVKLHLGNSAAQDLQLIGLGFQVKGLGFQLTIQKKHGGYGNNYLLFPAGPLPHLEFLNLRGQALQPGYLRWLEIGRASCRERVSSPV